MYTKNFFYCIVMKKKVNRDGYYAFATKIRQTTNLVAFIRDYHGTDVEIYAMNACATMKEAQNLAGFQNDTFKANGTYALEMETE